MSNERPRSNDAKDKPASPGERVANFINNGGKDRTLVEMEMARMLYQQTSDLIGEPNAINDPQTEIEKQLESHVESQNHMGD